MIKYLHIIACLWLFTALNSFIVWNSYEFQIRFLSFIGVFISTIYLFGLRKTEVRGKLAALLSFGICFLWMLILFESNVFGKINLVLRFLPVIMLILWPEKLHYNIYELFRKCVLFFAAGSIIVDLLYLLGLIGYVPYFDLEAQSSLHERSGIFYRIYICIVTNYPIFYVIPRACGFLQEPGHFAVVLGYIYITDSFIQKKRNLLLIVCGLLTFSSNFILMFVIAEVYNLVNIRKIGKIIVGVIVFLFVVIFVSRSLNDSVKEKVMFLSYGRNLESVFDAFSSSRSLDEALNERINKSGEMAWSKINESNIWTGLFGEMDEDVILSDYRGAILRYGLIGLFLMVLTFFIIPIKLPIKQHLQLLLFLILVMLHRSWMFFSPYLYYMMFLSSMSYCVFAKQKNIILNPLAELNNKHIVD